MGTYRDLDYIGETHIVFLKEKNEWYIELYDPDCKEGCAPVLLLDKMYQDEDIKRIRDNWIPNAEILKYD